MYNKSKLSYSKINAQVIRKYKYKLNKYKANAGLFKQNSFFLKPTNDF